MMRTYLHFFLITDITKSMPKVLIIRAINEPAKIIIPERPPPIITIRMSATRVAFPIEESYV